jgi:hypothetical protein
MTQPTYIDRTQYLTPLVGNGFRLSGRLILPTLSEGTPLILEPEPDNPYDEDAIKVLVDMYGSQYAVDPQEHLLIHLGYIPRSGGRYDTLQFGNRSVLMLLNSPDEWEASLTFSPQGNPLVRLTLA